MGRSSKGWDRLLATQMGFHVDLASLSASITRLEFNLFEMKVAMLHFFSQHRFKYSEYLQTPVEAGRV
jgi:hypothetical protein